MVIGTLVVCAIPLAVYALRKGNWKVANALPVAPALAVPK
jgi:hypothetical protein